MKRHTKGAAAALAVLAIAGVAAVASAHDSPELSDAGAANTKTPGVTLPDKLSPQLRQITVAQGSNVLENPSRRSGTMATTTTGRCSRRRGRSVARTQRRGDEVRAGQEHLPRRRRPARCGPGYDYGTHFLYQGHELRRRLGYITRINLDADAAHRVTMLAEFEADGRRRCRRSTARRGIRSHSGCSSRPRAARAAASSQATLDFPSKVRTLWGILGQGGYEGIQNDSAGNIYIVEDSGGRAGTVNKNAQAAEQLPVPLPALRPDRHRQGRQAAGAAGRVARPLRADRLPPGRGGRRHPVAGRRRPAHLRQDVRRRRGSRSTTRP